MQTAVRQVRPDEASAVAGLLLRANEENLAAFPDAVASAYRRELLDPASRGDGVEVLVLHVDGRLAGCVALLADAATDTHPWPPGGSVLRFLAVEPDERGHGHGELLARAVIDLAREGRSRFLALHTAPTMGAARRLYARLGFVRAPEHDFHPDAHYGGDSADGAEPWGLAYLLPLA